MLAHLVIKNPLFLITTIALLFYAGYSMNNAIYGQQVVDNTNRTVSPGPAPENEAIVALPTPSTKDLSPETEQQAGMKEKVENSDKSKDNGASGKVEQAESQKDEVSESDQTSEDRQAQVSEDEEDRQAQVSEDEEKEDNSDEREEENDNDDVADDIPFELPFP